MVGEGGVSLRVRCVRRIRAVVAVQVIDCNRDRGMAPLFQNLHSAYASSLAGGGDEELEFKRNIVKGYGENAAQTIRWPIDPCLSPCHPVLLVLRVLLALSVPHWVSRRPARPPPHPAPQRTR